MIIAHTKWGDELYETAYGLLKQRVEDGFYYDNWDDGNPKHQWEDRAKAVVNFRVAKCIGHPSFDEREKAAWVFLRERSDHEYEGVEEASVGP